MTKKSSSAFSPMVTILLLGVVAALMAVPLVMNSGAQFGGTDNAGMEAIAEINPEAAPWFQPLWSPPGGEMQTLLFSLQAAIGAGAVGYCLGLKRGQRERGAGSPDASLLQSGQSRDEEREKGDK
ncbi:MAG: energy-coupling factor ABC transporter substrate-binding protein [Chloroflexi bacterium]|nr:energy-coupling factor ABC transporter substrate-binding protein [Chloroflexota bacterium]